MNNQIAHEPGAIHANTIYFWACRSPPGPNKSGAATTSRSERRLGCRPARAHVRILDAQARGSVLAVEGGGGNMR